MVNLSRDEELELLALDEVMYTRPLTQNENEHRQALLDKQASKPGVYFVKDGEKWWAICICGHPVVAHEKANTEYAVCRLHDLKGCECKMHSRTVAYVRGDMRTFRRRARGAEEPHPLNGAIAKVDPDNVLWMTTTCDSCETDGVTLTAVALDGQDRMMIREPGKKARAEDYGKHKLVCDSCYQEAAKAPVENTMESLGMNRALIMDLLKNGGKSDMLNL